MYVMCHVLQEKLKVTALEEEMRRMVNVHRWRTLQDTNADHFEMIKKVRGIVVLISQAHSMRGREWRDVERGERREGRRSYRC